jgi:endo-1,4-beta-mannosidase
MIKLFKTKDSANLCVRPVADYDIYIIRPSSLQRKKIIIMKNNYRFLMSKVNNLNFILCEENMCARSLLSLLSH